MCAFNTAGRHLRHFELIIAFSLLLWLGLKSNLLYSTWHFPSHVLWCWVCQHCHALNYLSLSFVIDVLSGGHSLEINWNQIPLKDHVALKHNLQVQITLCIVSAIFKTRKTCWPYTLTETIFSEDKCPLIRPFSQGTRWSQRRCCTCCYCLHELFRHLIWHRSHLQSPSAAQHCCWHSRNSGLRLELWRWPGPWKKKRREKQTRLLVICRTKQHK